MGQKTSGKTEPRSFWVCLNGTWHPGTWYPTKRTWHVSGLEEDYAFNEIQAIGDPISSESLNWESQSDIPMPH